AGENQVMNILLILTSGFTPEKVHLNGDHYLPVGRTGFCFDHSWCVSFSFTEETRNCDLTRFSVVEVGQMFHHD
ncbi:MAG: hypothetical protein O6939_13185, partial [Bacteroidetes bacterium]|nr:hypothetical protein [Bacteroidota bacterium]